MNRKVVLVAVGLILIISVGVVYAQETGFFVNIADSNVNLSTSITNSTVIENVTLVNGTLNLQINADNISTVTINGVNYTATPLGSTAPGNPNVIITYFGENMVPPGLPGFPNPWIDFWTNQSTPPFYYSWNLTLVNINPISGVGTPMGPALEPLVAKYPMLAKAHVPIPNSPPTSGPLTLWVDIAAFNGKMDKQCMVLFSYNQLTGDQIANLTEDLTTQLTPAIIEWYS